MTTQMKAELLEPLVAVTVSVLSTEAGLNATRRNLYLTKSASLTHEVTVIIGLTGALHGLFLLGMSRTTARAIAAHMFEAQDTELNEMAQSAIAELGNIIAGQATTRLALQGYPATLSPPGLIIGRDCFISTLAITRLVVQFDTEVGLIEIQLAVEQRT